MRRADFGTLLCPEFSLRKAPRITVRGQTVQSVRLVLRKAPLRSRVCPWSTKRPCGPLAFRCATAGSRSAKEGKGSQEGTGNHTWCPVPFCPCRWAPTIPGRRRRPMSTLTLSVNLASSGAPLYRRNRLPSAEGKRGVFAALRRNILHCAAGFDMMKIPERGRII